MWNRGCISGQRAPLKQVQTAFNYLSTGGGFAFSEPNAPHIFKMPSDAPALEPA